MGRHWNARVTYVLSSQTVQWEAREAFCTLVQDEFPEVLRTLKEKVLPLYREATTSLYEQRSPVENHMRLSPHAMWDYVHGRPSVPECQRALAGLHSWAEGFKLDCPWIRRNATDTMRSWAKPRKREPTEGEPLFEVDSGRFAEGHLSWLGLLDVSYRPQDSYERTPLPVWMPEEESLDHFQRRIRHHIRHQQQAARELKLIPDRMPRTVRGRTPLDRMRWLALRRIRGLTFEQIVEHEQRRTNADSPIDESGVRWAIHDLEERLELPR